MVHRRCPRRPILEDPALFQELFWLYRQKEKGYLVNAGGLEDQPAVLVECYRIIDATLANIAAHQKDLDDRKKKRAAMKSNQATRMKAGRGRRR